MALKNYQYNSIMRTYEERQNETRHLLDSRREEIYKKIPKYRELELAIVDASIEVTPLLMEARKEDADRELAVLKARISDLREEKLALLRKYGYQKDYLEPVYTCPDCKDTGYINGSKCHCFRQAMVDMLYDQSNLKLAIKKDNFRNFRLDLYPDETDEEGMKSPRSIMTDNLNKAKAFVKNFDKESSNLFLYGEVGLGKTYLSSCIANELLSTGHTVLYQTAHQIINKLGEIKFNSYGEEPQSDIRDYIFGCDLLIIDDIGSEMVTEFSSSELNVCISERLIAKRSTILSSNLDFHGIKDTYGDRLFSRIMGNYILLPFKGKDIRYMKRYVLDGDKN